MTPHVLHRTRPRERPGASHRATLRATESTPLSTSKPRTYGTSAARWEKAPCRWIHQPSRQRYNRTRGRSRLMGAMGNSPSSSRWSRNPTSDAPACRAPPRGPVAPGRCAPPTTVTPPPRCNPEPRRHIRPRETAWRRGARPLRGPPVRPGRRATPPRATTPGPALHPRRHRRAAPLRAGHRRTLEYWPRNTTAQHDTAARHSSTTRPRAHVGCGEEGRKKWPTPGPDRPRHRHAHHGDADLAA